MEALKRFWIERNERERKVLLFAFFFVFSALAYAFVLQPGEKERIKLRREIPQLKEKLAEMRMEASEIERSTKAPGRDAARDIKGEIEASANSAGMGLKSIEKDGDGQVHAEFPSVSFDRWVTWVEKVEKDAHVRLVSGHIQRLDQIGNVRINAAFAPWGKS